MENKSVSEELTTGIEVECFDPDHTTGEDEEHGKGSADAAPDLGELIGEPASEPTVAINHMRVLADRYLSSSARFVIERPNEHWRNRNVWRIHTRYEALKKALQQECPGNWRGVDIMTNRAATHVSVGVDWAKPEGAALLSVINNIAPQVSSALCQRHRISCDSLFTPWHGWADSRRFPSADLWWSTLEEIITYYALIPRLIRPGEAGESEVVPDLSVGSGCMQATYHLGTVWLLARPKIAPDNTKYIELRILPSMDPREAVFEDVVMTLVGLVKEIVKRCTSNLQCSQAADLFSDLRNCGYLSLVPEKLLTAQDWQGLPVWAPMSEGDTAAIQDAAA